jgi:hypothetical protein
MAYSLLLMTSIFVKQLSEFTRADENPLVPSTPRGCRNETVMRTELQCFGSRAGVMGAGIDPIRASRHLAYAMLTSAEVSLGNTMSKRGDRRGNR